MSDSALGDGSNSYSFGGIMDAISSGAEDVVSAATDALTKQIDKGSSPTPVNYAPAVNTVPFKISAQTKQVLLWGAGAVGVLILLKILKVL